MNKHRVSLMLQMLLEVQAGTWKGIKLKPIDIAAFVRPEQEDFGKPDTFNLRRWIARNSASPCGYTACAIGHATLDPRFRKLGLKQDMDGVPEFQWEEGFEAVRDFFNFDVDYTDQLLYSPSYYPQANAAKTLEQVIRRHKLLLELGEEKFGEKFPLRDSQRKLVSPQGRVYNVSKTAR